jgi:YD repeat-containing protein
LLTRTTAAGTAVAQTLAYTWQGNNPTRIEYRDASGTPYLAVAYTYATSGVSAGRLASEVWTDLTTAVQRRTDYSYGFYANGSIASLAATRASVGGTSATTSVSYDSLGNITASTNALGHATTYSAYNGLGLPGRVTDPNGIAVDYSYSDDGKLLSLTRRLPTGDRTVTLAYTPLSQLQDALFPDGSAQRARYNGSGRRVQVGNAQGEFAQTDLDIASNTWRSSSARNLPSWSGSSIGAVGASSFTSTVQTDSLGRPYKVLGNNGQQQTFTYDSSGRLTTVSDAAGHTTRYDYDAQGQLIQSTAPDGGIVRYGYDSRGGLASVTDPRGLVTSYNSNGFGDRISISSPDTGTTSYTVDNWGRVLTETRANGQGISYAWDTLNRLTSRSSSGPLGSAAETLSYDQGSYAKGRLSGVSDAAGSTTYAYSAAGELLQQTSTVAGQSLSTSWSYDGAGRLIGMTYPAGLSLGYSYDAYGRLSGVTSNHAGSPATVATNLLYQPATDQLYAFKFGNGLPRMASFDADGRLIQLDSQTVHKLSLDYTNTNTLWRISDLVYSGQTTTYSYDPSNRVTGASGAVSNSFAWDTAGNRSSQTLSGSYLSHVIDSRSTPPLNGRRMGRTGFAELARDVVQVPDQYPAPERRDARSLQSAEVVVLAPQARGRDAAALLTLLAVVLGEITHRDPPVVRRRLRPNGTGDDDGLVGVSPSVVRCRPLLVSVGEDVSGGDELAGYGSLRQY